MGKKRKKGFPKMQTLHMASPKCQGFPPTAVPKHLSCSPHLQAPARAGLALSPLLGSPAFLCLYHSSQTPPLFLLGLCT